MATALTTLQILERLRMRVQQRISALESVRLSGYDIALYELRLVSMKLTKAMEYVRELERKKRP